MSSLPDHQLTSEEYLVIERDCELKHEFFRGEMFAMSGATRAHCAITFNLARHLGNQLADRNCTAFVNDMRVKVSESGLYTYPDGVVTCEEPRYEDDQFDTLLNPQVIIEVLSKSTESYDRGKKFEHYRQIGSLRDYVLIAQDRPHVERFSCREDRQWLLADVSGLDAKLELPTIDGSLALADLYAKVQFPAS